MHDAGPIYLNVGCGYAAPAGWVNIDASPTARIEKLPLIGKTLARLSGNAELFPDTVRYGDVTAGQLYPDGSVKAVYASHVLEHLALDDMRNALRHIFAMLSPGGTLRLIVPDLEQRARNYLAQRDAGDAGASHEFMKSCYLGKESRSKGLLGRARGVLGNSEHLWMWDEASMRAELGAVGFVAIRRASFGDSPDAMFARVEHPTRFVDGTIEEIALEALKPAAA